jgi:type II secretory ATPase GspE/PulE/Tfp pilus assembly ATPase PilB-like protein/RNA polymerase subunit RPABC4/transcription elongation factor Spt4
MSMHASIVSRIKVMSELDISERRKPQDGRVTVRAFSKIVDMRISTLPTITGEKVVLRILDKGAAIKDIEELGLSDRDLVKISQLVSQPQGVVLTTGPTGSGKTSTLYSLLRKEATPDKNYVTIEDPVEYFMSMAGQVVVREKIGLRFPVVLRSLLRQDPDVIMLGEIRDIETAEAAFRAAITGHLVLTTLHTNSSIASITRLRDMGMKSYVISEAVRGIMAQRLVRRVCPHCSMDDDVPDRVLRALNLHRKTLDFTPKKGSGCEHCDMTGYSGRIGVFEVFLIDEELKKMIHTDTTETELVKAARMGGMTTLLEDGIAKVKAGTTTCEELIRVLGAQNIVDIACPECGIHLEERFQFCPFCGGSVVSRCSNCRRLLDPPWKTCPYCGENAPASS